MNSVYSDGDFVDRCVIFNGIIIIIHRSIYLLNNESYTATAVLMFAIIIMVLSILLLRKGVISESALSALAGIIITATIIITNKGLNNMQKDVSACYIVSTFIASNALYIITRATGKPEIFFTGIRNIGNIWNNALRAMMVCVYIYGTVITYCSSMRSLMLYELDYYYNWHGILLIVLLIALAGSPFLVSNRCISSEIR